MAGGVLLVSSSLQPRSLTVSLLLGSLHEICMLDSAVSDDLLNAVWICLNYEWITVALRPGALQVAASAAHNCNSVIAASTSSLEILRSL